jgi:carboxymethylenebutenolidase
MSRRSATQGGDNGQFRLLSSRRAEVRNGRRAMPSRVIPIHADERPSFAGYLAIPRSGSGPGLVLAPGRDGVDRTMRRLADRFAEEGYATLVPEVSASAADLSAAAAALGARRECSGAIGIVGFGRGGALASRTRNVFAVVIAYDTDAIAPDAGGPVQIHLAENDPAISAAAVARLRRSLAGNARAEIHVYPRVGRGFWNHDRAKAYDKPTARFAHTRAIALLHSTIGPTFDLARLWDEHVRQEIVVKDVDATMATMVAEPYVNHVPTMTGGTGYRELYRFYRDNFISKHPGERVAIPISRTVGPDRVIDEVYVRLKHDIEIDWLLPGIAPTGKWLEAAFIVVACFRGDKLYHEHIYWDQASLLVQLGLIDAKRLPVGGAEVARKLLDESLPANGLIVRAANRRTRARPQRRRAARRG